MSDSKQMVVVRSTIKRDGIPGEPFFETYNGLEQEWNVSGGTEYWRVPLGLEPIAETFCKDFEHLKNHPIIWPADVAEDRLAGLLAARNKIVASTGKSAAEWYRDVTPEQVDFGLRITFGNMRTLDKRIERIRQIAGLMTEFCAGQYTVELVPKGATPVVAAEPVQSEPRPKAPPVADAKSEPVEEKPKAPVVDVLAAYPQVEAALKSLMADKKITRPDSARRKLLNDGLPDVTDEQLTELMKRAGKVAPA